MPPPVNDPAVFDLEEDAAANIQVLAIPIKSELFRLIIMPRSVPERVEMTMREAHFSPTHEASRG